MEYGTYNDPDVVLASDEERKAYWDNLGKILRDGMAKAARTPEETAIRKELLEQIARRMATAAGYDPETPTQLWPPYRISTPWGEVFQVISDSIAPLWTRYLGAAESALSAIEDATR